MYKKEFFHDCEAILTETPRLLGLDGRKMSKSFNNAINLSDPEKEVEKKVKGMFTDPKRIKLTDPGHPKKCNVYSYYNVFVPEKTEEVYAWCTKAQKGCTDCKTILSKGILDHLKEIREKRHELEKDKDKIRDILKEGQKKASVMAKATIAQIKDIIFT